jgi:predicted Zn-dependent peptidase
LTLRANLAQSLARALPLAGCLLLCYPPAARGVPLKIAHQQFQLKNGLNVILHPDPRLPPRNAAMVVAGQLDTARARKLVQRYRDVTPAVVHRFCRKLLDPGRRVLLVVEPRPQAQPRPGARKADGAHAAVAP